MENRIGHARDATQRPPFSSFATNILPKEELILKNRQTILVEKFISDSRHKLHVADTGYTEADLIL
jgi:hypothetical protein